MPQNYSQIFVHGQLRIRHHSINPNNCPLTLAELHFTTWKAPIRRQRKSALKPTFLENACPQRSVSLIGSPQCKIIHESLRPRSCHFHYNFCRCFTLIDQVVTFFSQRCDGFFSILQGTAFFANGCCGHVHDFDLLLFSFFLQKSDFC